MLPLGHHNHRSATPLLDIERIPGLAHGRQPVRAHVNCLNVDRRSILGPEGQVGEPSFPIRSSYDLLRTSASRHMSPSGIDLHQLILKIDVLLTCDGIPSHSSGVADNPRCIAVPTIALRRVRLSTGSCLRATTVVDEDRLVTGHHIVRVGVGDGEVAHGGAAGEVVDLGDGDVVSWSAAAHAGAGAVAFESFVVVDE